MSELQSAAARFAPIALEELGDAALMRRVDRKYVVPADRLGALLAGCDTAYRILEVNGARLSRYATRYFDTPELTLYHAHHADRSPRAKIRIREYLDSGRHFMELKRRMNTGETHKSRVEMNGDARPALAALRAMREFGDTGITPDAGLDVVMHVAYTRVTLVRRGAAERVTIDVDIEMSDGVRTERFPGVAFAEVKQPRISASPFVGALRNARVREGAISKYCLGVASLITRARTNRFKPALMRLHDTATSRGPAHGI